MDFLREGLSLRKFYYLNPRFLNKIAIRDSNLLLSLITITSVISAQNITSARRIKSPAQFIAQEEYSEHLKGWLPAPLEHLRFSLPWPGRP